MPHSKTHECPVWKTFEHTSAAGPGIVSYITAASYLDGNAFVGMREHLRRLCDDVWIIDLGGEGRGTRRSDNVFAIQTPVAIAVAASYGKLQVDRPAKIHYARIDGTREEKLAKLDAIADFGDLTWERCPDDWHAPFRPAGKGSYFDWPQIIDLMPWQQSGVQVKRTWPIAPDEDTARRRWRSLLKADDRQKAFKETRDRKIRHTYPELLPHQRRERAIASLSEGAPAPEVVRYAYRSFDRQWLLADGRMGDFMRRVLWSVQSERQVYTTTLLNHPLGNGPAMTVAGEVPDLHHFRGSYGAREVIPLYRDAVGREPNILPGLLDLLTQEYKRKVGPDDFLAYIYGVLAQPAFTHRFQKELENRELRLPLTRDANLFVQVTDIGRRLVWLHTYSQRFGGAGRPKGRVPTGRAKCTVAVPSSLDAYPDAYRYDPGKKRLVVGAGVFEPVEPEIFRFEVSGLKVVESWLGYRMKSRHGKRSSSLDAVHPERWTAQFTTELLELLWVLEATVATYPQQEVLLGRVLGGPMFRARELPAVPEELRHAPVSQLGLFRQDDREED